MYLGDYALTEREQRKPLNVILISGASGSGKTYIRDMLVEYNNKIYLKDNSITNEITFTKPLQVTTRHRRIGEKPTDYIFMNLDYYGECEKENELTCKTHFNDNYYGTLINTLVYGENVYNLIVASLEGRNDFIKMFGGIEFVNIKTALVLSDIDPNIIKEHNNRDVSFVQDEITNLLSKEYDYYIPNYSYKRADINTVLNKLGFVASPG